MPVEVYFQVGHPGLLLDLLYFVCESTFGLYGSMLSLYVGLDCLV